MIFFQLRVTYAFVILHFPTPLPSPYTLASSTMSSSHPLNPQQTTLLLFHNLCLFDFFMQRVIGVMASLRQASGTLTGVFMYNILYHSKVNHSLTLIPTFAFVNVGMLTFLNPPKQFLKVNSVGILLLFLFRLGPKFSCELSTRQNVGTTLNNFITSTRD